MVIKYVIYRTLIFVKNFDEKRDFERPEQGKFGLRTNFTQEDKN